MSPLTRFRCTNSPNTTIGIITITPAAAIGPHSIPEYVMNEVIATGSVCVDRFVSTNAIRYSFHAHSEHEQSELSASAELEPGEGVGAGESKRE